MNYRFEVQVSDKQVKVVVVRESVPYLNSWDEPDYHDVECEPVVVSCQTRAPQQALDEALARAGDLVKLAEAE